MKQLIIKRKPVPIFQTNTQSSLYNQALAVTYGNVDSVNNNGTCNIRLVNGFMAESIRIPSSFYPSIDPVIGGIMYPPVGSEVIIIHPVNDLGSGFIMPAPLDLRNADVTDALLDDGNKEILPGGWNRTYDYATGEVTITNGTCEIVLNPDGETISFTDFHGNYIKSNGTTLEINGIIEVARKGDAVSISLTGTDIATLASSLLATGAFTPSGSPPVSGTPVSFSGEITEGSDKVKVG